MVAMDTKFRRIYCAISDGRIFLYFQLQLPQILPIVMKPMAY